MKAEGVRRALRCTCAEEAAKDQEDSKREKDYISLGPLHPGLTVNQAINLVLQSRNTGGNAYPRVLGALRPLTGCVSEAGDRGAPSQAFTTNLPFTFHGAGKSGLPTLTT